MLSLCAASEQKSQTACVVVHLLDSLLDILSAAGKAVAGLDDTAVPACISGLVHSRSVVVAHTEDRMVKILRAELRYSAVLLAPS